MLNRAELVHLVGNIDDARLTQILALQPSFAEVEEAVFWADGEAAELAKSGHALTGKAGAPEWPALVVVVLIPTSTSQGLSNSNN